MRRYARFGIPGRETKAPLLYEILPSSSSTPLRLANRSASTASTNARLAAAARNPAAAALLLRRAIRSSLADARVADATTDASAARRRAPPPTPKRRHRPRPVDDADAVAHDARVRSTVLHASSPPMHPIVVERVVVHESHVREFARETGERRRALRRRASPFILASRRATRRPAVLFVLLFVLLFVIFVGALASLSSLVSMFRRSMFVSNGVA